MTVGAGEGAGVAGREGTARGGAVTGITTGAGSATLGSGLRPNATHARTPTSRIRCRSTAKQKKARTAARNFVFGDNCLCRFRRRQSHGASHELRDGAWTRSRRTHRCPQRRHSPAGERYKGLHKLHDGGVTISASRAMALSATAGAGWQTHARNRAAAARWKSRDRGSRCATRRDGVWRRSRSRRGSRRASRCRSDGRLPWRRGLAPTTCRKACP